MESQRQGIRRILRHREQQRVSAKRTLVVAELAGSFDVLTTVSSGGVSSQADAVKLGVARALIVFNPELRKLLQARACSRAMRVRRTQEVRAEGRPQAVPVQQALTRLP